MTRSRFSLRGLLALILVAALGFGALSRPSCLTASAVFSGLLLSLTAALLGVVYRRGYKRACWSGFLLCGSLYATLSLAPWFDRHVSHRLVTTAILDFMYTKVPPLESTDNARNDPWTLWTGAPPDFNYAHVRAGFTANAADDYVRARAQFVVSTTDEFLLIGHSLFGMLAAVAGWCVAGYYYSARASNEVSADIA